MINHLMYFNDIKLLAKNEKELETLIQAVMIFNDDIGVEFGVEKRAFLIMKSRKWHMTEGIELPNQGNTRTLAVKETHKY